MEKLSASRPRSAFWIFVRFTAATAALLKLVGALGVSVRHWFPF